MKASLVSPKRALSGVSALLVLAMVPLASPWNPASADSSSPKKTTSTSASTAPTAAAKSTSAQLASTGLVGAGNGTAGVQQVVSVVAPKLHDTTVTVTASLAYINDSLTINLNSKGEGQTTWTPEAAGLWLLAADPSLGLATSRPTISPVPTVTSVMVPDKATKNIAFILTATVAAAAGRIPISGTVTFYQLYGGRLGSVNVVGLPNENAVATMPWVPESQGELTFYAEFDPAIDDQSGSSPLQGSTSDYARLNVGTSRSVVQLLMPPVSRIGQPQLVIANLPDMYAGTVSLVVDGREVSPPKETVDSVAAFTWEPTHTGLTYVTLELISDKFSRLERQVVQTVNVLPKLPPNPISVTPVIGGVAGAPWAAQDVLPYPAGSRIDLVSSTGNGAGVNIAQRGPCLLTGATLFVPETGGGCLVTFSAAGDGSFGENAAQVLISSAVTHPKAASKATAKKTSQSTQSAQTSQ